MINNGNWNLFSANPSGFGNGPNGSLGAGTVIDAAVGDVTGIEMPPLTPATATPTNPYRKPHNSSNVADLVTLVERVAAKGGRLQVERQHTQHAVRVRRPGRRATARCRLRLAT